MAKVKIQGHASGTGVLTVTAPNTSTDRTITLPDSTDTLAVNSDVTNKLPLAGGTMTGDLTLNGADIVKSGSADLTIDSGGRIDLSADDNGEIRLWDGSSKYAQFKDDDDRLKIQSMIQDKDIMFVGNDGGSEVTAMKLDMSEGGLAICYGGVAIGGAGTANTLDDYEEGTWTPTLTKGSATASFAYYTKIGRVVNFSVRLTSFTDTSSSDSIVIQGLPFTVLSTQAAGSVFGRYVNQNAGWTTTMTDGGAAQAYIYEWSDGNWRSLSYDLLDSSASQMYLCGTYTT